MISSTVKKPILTVCIITYNQEKLVRATLDSVFLQHRDEGIEGQLQCIIADDASMDSTPQILREYQQTYPEIIDLILHQVNGGITTNTNSFYPYIRGQYTILLGGDDLFLPGKLAKQVAFMQAHPDYVMSYHDTWVQNYDTGKRYRYNHPWLGQKSFTKDVAQKLITQRCFISCLSAMVRRKGTEDLRHSSEIRDCSDWIYFTELAIRGKVGYLNEILGIYYRHGNNITIKNPDFTKEEKAFAYLQKKYGELYGRDIQKALANLYMNYIFKYLLLRKWCLLLQVCRKYFILIAKNPLLIFVSGKSFFLNLIKRTILYLKMGSFHR